MKYRKEIDGLRALAIIPVILYHAGIENFKGGFIGVDIFFVISGFLISSIIFRELEDDNFSLVRFYERRARRILPALFLVLFCTIPLAWISLFQVDMIDYFESLTSTSLFYSNFLFAYEANYFDTSVELKPLLHSWTLSVEEQFYVFFPLVMIALWKLKAEKRVLLIVLLLVLISLGFSEWASHDPTEYNISKYNFFLLPSRLWELGFGVLVAIVEKEGLIIKYQKNRIYSRLGSIVGMLMILFGFYFITDSTRFPSIYALLPVVGTGFIIMFADSSNSVGRILSNRIFVIIGLISYSAYLWHHVVFSFSRHLSLTEESFVHKIGMILLVLLLSYISWNYVERPFRNKEKYSGYFILLFTIIGSVFFAFIGIVGVKFDGFPGRVVNQSLAYLSYEPDNRKLKVESWKYVNAAEEKFGEESWFEDYNDLPNLLLIGNSHSKDMYNAFLSSDTIQANFELGRFNGEVKDMALKEDLFRSRLFLESDMVMIVSHFYESDLHYIPTLVDKILAVNKGVIIVKEPFQFKMLNHRTLVDIEVHNYLRNRRFEANKSDSNFINRVNKLSYGNRITISDDLKKRADSIIDYLVIQKGIVSLDRNDYVSSVDEEISFILSEQFEKYFYDSRHTTIKGAEFFGKIIDETSWLSPIIKSDKY